MEPDERLCKACGGKKSFPSFCKQCWKLLSMRQQFDIWLMENEVISRHELRENSSYQSLCASATQTIWEKRSATEGRTD